MTTDNIAQKTSKKREYLLDCYKKTRALTEELVSKITPEDQTIQSMNDASPVKWHRAHTSWFFESFILRPYLKNFNNYNSNYNYLFNSYYDGAGERYSRKNRGLITRPDCNEITRYRNYIDSNIDKIIETSKPEIWEQVYPLIQLGLHHEKQHQELILMDILNAFSRNPTYPLYQYTLSSKNSNVHNQPLKTKWIGFSGGIEKIGVDSHGTSNFSFDNEEPQHEVIVLPFKIANKLITNLEWLAFMEDGGYDSPLFWLADGWATARRENWTHPLYWRKVSSSKWMYFSLNGLQELNLNAPVSHISFYEANAFARWRKKRLPTESEWEIASKSCSMNGNLLSSNILEPSPAAHSESLTQMIGDAWEFTQSPYTAYPGFRERGGTIGEYNGKFMSNQMVLRGGSCLTPDDHIRRTYRNYFYPHQRWMCSGIRLAEDN